MVRSQLIESVFGVTRQIRHLNTQQTLTKCSISNTSRSFATAVEVPTATSSQDAIAQSVSASPSTQPPTFDRVLTTLYSWPQLEPTAFQFYPSVHLNMPMRKDILHRAVIYEADNHRGWSTASTKWRSEVHGSNRKIAQQKGRGAARVGDKKSPSRRGGGVAFGPHPRDFSTELPKKIYDIAWRTALSHRYRIGELFVLNDKMTMPVHGTERFIENFFLENKWGRGNGRSLLVADRLDGFAIKSAEEEESFRMQERLFRTVADMGEHGMIKDLDDVDVKDLLETGRVVIDKFSLAKLLDLHSGDLKNGIKRVA